jgi:hypothetical protein
VVPVFACVICQSLDSRFRLRTIHQKAKATVAPGSAERPIVSTRSRADGLIAIDEIVSAVDHHARSTQRIGGPRRACRSAEVPSVPVPDPAFHRMVLPMPRAPHVRFQVRAADPGRRTSVQDIVSTLLEHIGAGRLPPGACLPPVRVLEQQLGVEKYGSKWPTTSSSRAVCW